jgi:quinol monooxygenase YgiN
LTVLSLQRFPVDAQQLAVFEDLAGRLVEAMRTAPGNLWADAARAFDDDPSYLVLSEWRGVADADAWDASQDALELEEGIYPLLRADPTRRRLAANA